VGPGRLGRYLGWPGPAGGAVAVMGVADDFGHGHGVGAEQARQPSASHVVALVATPATNGSEVTSLACLPSASRPAVWSPLPL
jgi:hypothetical protein